MFSSFLTLYSVAVETYHLVDLENYKVAQWKQGGEKTGFLVFLSTDVYRIGRGNNMV